MDINIFIKDFAEQFDDVDTSHFSGVTKFREVDGWSSLTGLSVLNMINKKYNVSLNSGELRQADTIKEVFDLVLDKRN
jgi:acyl carrier protein